MALQLPQAVRFSGFTGGWRGATEYMLINSTETSKESRNTVYEVTGLLSKRVGSKKLNRLHVGANDTSLSYPFPITGHYYFQKLGSTQTYHVVAHAGNIYNLSFSTTSHFSEQIRTGLNSGSESFWSFIQMQDPDSASDDMVLMTNGVDPIQIWTGTATATLLSSLTCAANAGLIFNHLLHYKQRLYGIGVIDAADADSRVRVFRSVFGIDGLSKPQQLDENFYVGGASRDGIIQNSAILDDQIIFYKQRAIWKFLPGAGGIGDVFLAKAGVGLFAPNSLIDTGDFHIFLSERGIRVYDGNEVVALDPSVDEFLLDDANTVHLSKARGFLDESKQRYKLYYASGNSLQNNKAIIYDIRQRIFQPPVTGRLVSFLSSYINSDNETKPVYADYDGHLYEDELTGTDQSSPDGFNDLKKGRTITDFSASFFNSASKILTAMTFSPAHDDASAGIQYNAMFVTILGGIERNKTMKVVTSTNQHDSTTVLLDGDFGPLQNTVNLGTDEFVLGAIDGFWRSKDYDFGAEDIRKIIRTIQVRPRETGNQQLEVFYLLDFRKVATANSGLITLFKQAFIWDQSLWDQGRWDNITTFKRKVFVRGDANQPRIGTHIAIAFSLNNAEAPYSIDGYDIVAKGVGRDTK